MDKSVEGDYRMTKNDQHLLKQMIRAGHFSYDIYELLIEHNKIEAQEMIKRMGNKWCLHPDNAVKRLNTPLPLLTKSSESKVLKRRKIEKEPIPFLGWA
jgi:hypothetical protein